MKILRTVLLLAAVLLWSAAADAAVRKSTDKVSVTLYTSQNQINPTQNLGVLIQFVMHDGWHIFAQNPGDIGLPTEVEWSLPQGWTLSEPQWSRFQKFETDGIVQYGYGKDAYYAAEIIPVPFREAKLSGSGFRGWPAKTNVFRKVSRLNCGFRLPHLI